MRIDKWKIYPHESFKLVSAGYSFFAVQVALALHSPHCWLVVFTFKSPDAVVAESNLPEKVAVLSEAEKVLPCTVAVTSPSKVPTAGQKPLCWHW